ncbi:hypothetical protein M2T28_20135 [Elizabethkingia miricola]|uniref:hypothetical protein n=1 Tax=Elizabethkingia miricola TaxID=172045 RepID=UPI00201876B2|nr:hypothetical protein [Elizabethkingia miricola]MCL1654937.1 hypothetical protein [Elizabethkingia miricola]
MKNINVTSLHNQLDKLRQMVENREDYFSERSEKWQESEKGEAFEYKTQELEGIADDLENLIDSMKEWNND